MLETNLNILWISDIHFSVNYEESLKTDEFNSYLRKFRNVIAGLLQGSPKMCFDYIFLTGDLAQAGIKVDYDFLFDQLIAPLLDLFLAEGGTLPKVVTIPGNHDVDWGNTGFLTTYLNSIVPVLNKDEDRSAYFADQPDKFYALFNDYQEFINVTIPTCNGGKYKEFFNFNSPQEFIISPNYATSRLQGYLIDHAKGLIIVLLNTAWFSLGGRFNELFAGETAGDTDWTSENRLDKIKDILKKKDYISEYNNQITGINLFEYSGLMSLFEKHKDYFVITCMHHPQNWLQWSEVYSYNPDKPENANRLNSILSHSNLILSGHEHVPRNVKATRISNSCIALKSGCFLFDNQHKQLNLANGWFSVLRINTNKAIIVQDKHYFNHLAPSKNWELNEESDTEVHRLAKKNNGYNIDIDRSKRFAALFSAFNEEKLKRFLSSKLDDTVTVTNVSAVDIGGNEYFLIYKVLRSDHEELCFVAKRTSVYWYMTTPGFFELADSLHEGLGKGIKIIRFVILDQFVDTPDTTNLSDKEQFRFDNFTIDQKIHQIVNFADSMFDIFRYQFFVRFEGALPGIEEEEKAQRFKHYNDLQFINCVVPFFVAENFWIKD